MTISLAALPFAKMSLGALEIQKASLGDAMLWSAGVSVTDNFNRTSLGANWATRGITDATVIPVITSNRFSGGTPASYMAGYEMAGIYTATAAVTDTHASRATVTAAPNEYNSGLIVRASANLQNLVLAKITTTATETGIWTMVNGTLTRRKTDATTSFKSGDIAEFRVSGNIYQLIRNPDTTATVVASWTDTGNLVAPSEARRYGGLWVSSQGSFGGHLYSPALDDFRFRDL